MKEVVKRWKREGQSKHGDIVVSLVKLDDGSWGISLERHTKPGDTKTPYTDFSECGEWFRTGITMTNEAYKLLRDIVVQEKQESELLRCTLEEYDKGTAVCKHRGVLLCSMACQLCCHHIGCGSDRKGFWVRCEAQGEDH